MTAVIVQCRLSSTRLPGKALKNLGGRPILAWVLESMHQLTADAYYVATDEASFPELAPVVLACGWECFAGPQNDVLERYCLLIEKIKADVVIRATADNPFLFYEAARALQDEYINYSKFSSCDYITWTGLPHGSGVEILNARSLLEAKKHTDSPYDHEHVGPALYNHEESYSIIKIPAPRRWNFPLYRTTIDTAADYFRAQTIVQQLSDGNAPERPYTADQIVSAFQNPAVSHPVLCIPSTKKGRGTGHLRRCLDIAKKIGAAVYIPENADLSEVKELVTQYIVSGLFPWQIISMLPVQGEYSLIFTDAFALEETLAEKLFCAAPLASLDESSPYTGYCDYILDVIPSVKNTRLVNMSEPEFIELPINKRTGEKAASASDFRNILISAGGEDPADLVIPTAIEFAKAGKSVTAIKSHAEEERKRISGHFSSLIKIVDPFPGLREKLASYDLVVTHYGLTAYEAAAAGCAVLLLGTTPLHVELAAKYGFRCIPGKITAATLKAVLREPDKLYVQPVYEQKKKHVVLGDFVRQLSYGRRFECPVCNMPSTAFDEVVARTSGRTFRRCSRCGILYMSWTIDSEDTSYGKSYFFDQYRLQYGKTYLDDFATIKAQCVRRTSIIDLLYHRKLRSATTPAILDIGCAYGPFLAAAADAGWQVFGTDVSPEAVEYVRNKLLFPATCAVFPDFNSFTEFGIVTFDAITMWYVIEHFRNLDAVLKAVSGMIKPGGVFAFSTPSAAGVSARFNRLKFFEESPADHYTLWEPARVKEILAKYGFCVVKIVNTGHHPERFPAIIKHGYPKKSLMYALASAASLFFRLGDTFEVYCKKNS
jgi:spore coat polysaccharide biosynthesis protein SpsF (cytidylyltransferase family)/2-polyprenyl-3-methyl-5-hydroxy-6-metoxy-1,4-benzoquinol methylase/spore coat polysaccharide biosynthesis predicted glycosyltransferase SpsG